MSRAATDTRAAARPTTSKRALEDGATIRLGRRASLVFRSDAADPTATETSGV